MDSPQHSSPPATHTYWEVVFRVRAPGEYRAEDVTGAFHMILECGLEGPSGRVRRALFGSAPAN